MDTEYLVHLNRLLSLLEEDAHDIKQAIGDDLLTPYASLLQKEIQATKQEIFREKTMI